ncbi:mannose-1-phosphate guanylyltransferase/mannose-6-phosphate isomerase [Pseudomonas sp. YQ_5]|uniref:mannose-1-phosphate guanylyltransferase/mannose-6-phosphate isomerase n=1 Tax=unclassified Pseudomonas TaxID=196821 RepID=UPI00370A705D|nr:mannose-1-phosphate guanylyltransferase/mannose-6-phosphate isomerase [Pseudomonas putida]
MIVPVIMAGGSGTRLWPLSRQLNPKQFISLIDPAESMLQTTLRRLEGLDASPPLLICNDSHRFLAAEQVRAIGLQGAQILLEPEGKNTAPAITLAAIKAIDTYDDPLLLILAADHDIPDVQAFHKAVESGVRLAESEYLVTFGIVPTHPETGYGYIEKGPQLEIGGFSVSQFVEKPLIDTAKKYIDSGKFLWNSGMFLFKASSYLNEVKALRPDIFECCQRALEVGTVDLDFVRVDPKSFSACPAESIDYAIMERTPKAAVVPLDAGWNDIGSWSALWEVSAKDKERNVLKGDVIVEGALQNYIYSQSRLVAAVGVQDLIIVETKDAVLVCNKNNVQDVKKVVERINEYKRSEHISHREVYRPWGMYDSIGSGPRYQVKHICVKPGGKLSVQMHHHRAEHWIVVSGTAKVSNGEKTYLVTENQSTYIPIGQTHSLENPGIIPLELIEVQSGAYLGEDDIVRFDDIYGRAE